MTGRSPLSSKPAGDSAAARSLEDTVRIEHDRRRLAQAVLASGIGMLALLGMLVVSLAHRSHAAPGWTLVPLGLAMLIAMLGFLRNINRLQDGDPALVISPRGLSFRPKLFGEIVRIPWGAIRGFKSRHYKQQRLITLQVDDVDRFVARAGFFGSLRRHGESGSATGRISFSTPMAKSAWAEVETLLQRYLAEYGRPSQSDAGEGQGQRRANLLEGLKPSPDNPRRMP